MENQPPTTTASAWLNRTTAAPDEGDGEIARLKERLSFYETFDRIIQDNVSRAGDLLRHAAATQENAEQERARVRHEMEELRTGDRQQYRSLLSGMLDEVTTMQVQIERLARRVADALDDLEVTLPAGSEFGRLSATSTVTEPPIDTTPPLPIEPTMDELLPPEPLGEAEQPENSIEPAEDGEAEVIAAEIETAEANGIAQESDVADLATGASEIAAAAFETESGDVDASETPEPDTELVVDEVVQAPTETPELPGDAGKVAAADVENAQGELGDGVLTEETSSAGHALYGHETAPAAPAEENTVDAVSTQETQAEAAAPAEESPSSDPAPSRLPWISSDVRPFTVEGFVATGIRRPVTGDLRMPEPSPRPAVDSSVALAGNDVATAVLIHGVPRATTALSLKRFLEGLPHIATVEPREYAEGILRLHVTGQRPLTIDDLRGWSDGGELEPVHLRDDLIEVRLPT